MTEQRNYRRLNFRTEAGISIENSAYPCDLVDLALQGALFRSDRDLPLTLGTPADLNIYLPDSSVRMEFTGELIHQRGNFYGFIFTSEDAESLGHLRRLLELNFGDAKRAEKEFSHWLKRDPID